MGTPNAGVAMPCSDGGFFYPVVSPKRDEGVVVTFLADTFFGAINHWDHAAIACTGDPATCYGCRHNFPRRWTGYIAAFLRSNRTRVIAQLSHYACTQLLEPLEKNGTLRGITVELRRKDAKRKNAAVMVKVLGIADGSTCIEEHPILPSLNKLWGLNLDRMRNGNSSPRPDLRGDPMPQPRYQEASYEDYSPPTPEQMARLRRTIGDIGRMTD